MATKAEQKLMELYQQLTQQGYHAEVLKENNTPMYVALFRNQRTLILEYNETGDLYGLGQLFAEEADPERISLGFSVIFRDFHADVLAEYDSLTETFRKYCDYIDDPEIYQSIYQVWISNEMCDSGFCPRIHKQEKLSEIYRLLRQDGYRADLLLKDGQIEYVAVPIHERVVIIDYWFDPYYNLGEVGCIYGKETHGVSFFHGVTKYESAMLEQYVSQINPEPVLYLGGMEKYRELCELAESDSDDPDRVAELQEAYEHTADAAQYRMAYEAWLEKEQLTRQ